MRFVADTHCFLWYLQGSAQLSKTVHLLFEQETPRSVVVPTIVLAELLFISRKASHAFPFTKTLDLIEKDPRFEIHPLTQAVIRRAAPLTTLEMHDALIVGTAVELGLPVMTRDSAIIGSGQVKIIECD